MKKPKQTPQGTPRPKAPTVCAWPKARTAEVKPNCPRVGDEGKVAYPPFLVAYDSEQEGERAVNGRLTKPLPKEKNREVKR